MLLGGGFSLVDRVYLGHHSFYDVDINPWWTSMDIMDINPMG